MVGVQDWLATKDRKLAESVFVKAAVDFAGVREPDYSITPTEFVKLIER